MVKDYSYICYGVDWKGSPWFHSVEEIASHLYFHHIFLGQLPKGPIRINKYKSQRDVFDLKGREVLEEMIARIGCYERRATDEELPTKEMLAAMESIEDMIHSHFAPNLYEHVDTIMLEWDDILHLSGQEE
jgi:hypothetical protein